MVRIHDPLWHDHAVLGVVDAAAEDGAPHGVGAPGDDGAVAVRHDGQVDADGEDVVRVAHAHEEEVVVLVLDVLLRPLHVVGDHEEHAVVLGLPELS